MNVLCTTLVHFLPMFLFSWQPPMPVSLQNFERLPWSSTRKDFDGFVRFLLKTFADATGTILMMHIVYCVKGTVISSAVFDANDGERSRRGFGRVPNTLLCGFPQGYQ